jgi:hypothetical protein
VNTTTKPRRNHETLIDLLDPEEAAEFAAGEAELYAEIASDLGLENSSDILDPLIEAEYRSRVASWNASLDGATPDPTEILRSVAGAYKDFATRVDRKRGHWKRKTQPALDINAKRGTATRQRVTNAADKFATKLGITWPFVKGGARQKIIGAAAKEAGISLSHARRLLNNTK